MAGRKINVWIENWTNDGVNVQVPRYSVSVRIEWTKADGTPGSHENAYRFPNALQNVPVARLRRYMEEIILREVRIQLGIDEAQE